MNKITAVAYYGGIPSNNNNLEKPKILDYFIEGVLRCNDIGIAHRGMNAIPCDVALIQGYVHNQSKMLPHLELRRQAINLQKQNKKRSLIVDSNLFLYINKKNPLHYLRYSFDGVFPTTGFYFDKEINKNRWKQISTDMNLALKPWRTNGSKILICLQRNGGWSMQGLGVLSWLDNTIKHIRQYTDRPIVIRTHPGDKKTKVGPIHQYKNIIISNNESLVADLLDTWASVVYNSSPSVASIIEGVPSFVTDPNYKNSQSFEVANFDISKIENPELKERQNWIEKLSMCHWKFDELKSGEAWQYFKRHL